MGSVNLRPKGRTCNVWTRLITLPLAQRYFTQADQVDQLVSAREADPDRGFMAQTMALCSLPRSNPPATAFNGKTWRGWNRGLMRWSISSANCASAWRIWKDCWKGCARPSADGRRPARAMMEEKYPEDATEL